MKANRITQIVLAAGIALTASVPAFSAPASSLQESSTPTTATGNGASGEQAPGKRGAPGEPRHHGERGHRGHHGHHGDRAGDKGPGMMLRGIDLTAEQKTKVNALHKAAAPEMRAAMKEAFEARRALHELTVSGSFDEAKAREIAQKGADAMARASVLKAKTHSQVLAVLTPEQRKELADRAEQRKERMEQRMQERAKKQQEKAAPAAGNADKSSQSASPQSGPAQSNAAAPSGTTPQPDAARPDAARPAVTQ